MARNPYEKQYSWTAGKSKCTHCGDYEDDRIIDAHEKSCRHNPDNQREED